MAISEDRLSISEITKGEVSDFQKTVDSSISSITGAVNGISSNVEDGINSALAGFEKKTSDLLDPIKKIDIPFSSQTSGILDNLLCLKIPDIDFRLPSFKLDIFKDWDFSFNMKICGESKKINPVDAAISVVDKLENPSSFINNTKKEIVDKLVTSKVEGILGHFGASQFTNCILGDSLSGVKDYNSVFGNSLNDKKYLKDLLDLDGCAGEFIQSAATNNGVGVISTKSILEKLAYTKNSDSSDQMMSGMRSIDPNNTARATSSMMSSSESIDAVYTKTDMVSNSYYAEFKDAEKQSKVDAILNNDIARKAKLLTPLDLNNDNLSIQEKMNVQTDSTNMFKSIANSEIYTKDKLNTFNNIILTADLIDKQWDKDELGNTNVYKLKNNSNMASLTKEYINTKKVDVDSSLTGDVSTNINIAERILAANLDFKETVLV